MVEYGHLNREKHKKYAEELTLKKVGECTFSPKLVANRSPKVEVHGDRGVYMYEKAMAGSKLISKYRSDRDPLDI